MKTIVSAEGAERPSGHAHHLVLSTAEAMGHELFDTMMLDNEWFAQIKKVRPGQSTKEIEKWFVRKNLKKLLPQARATLAVMIARTNDAALKETIMDALILDNTLRKGRGKAQVAQ